MGTTLTADFTAWDDPHTITQNPAFNPPSWSAILKVWNPRNPVAALWVPVTYTLWGLIAQASYLTQPDPYGVRLNPANFHAANLAVHLVNSLLVLNLLRRVIRTAGGQVPELACLLGAAFFAVHPLQVESVGWVSGFKDVLWGFWSLAAVACYLQWLESSAEPGDLVAARSARRQAWWYLSLLCFILGTLSKPTAMVIPVLIAIVHAVVLQQGWRAALLGGRVWIFCAFVPVVMAWTRYAQPGSGDAGVALALRALVATDSIAFYLGKLFFPIGINYDYGRTPAVIVASGTLYWSWIFPVAIAAVLWLRRKRLPAVAGAGLWALVAIAPVLGLKTFLFQYYSNVADHYVYVAMAGAALAGASLLSQLPGRFIRPAQTLAGVAILILTGISVVDMRAWHDAQSLCRHGIERNPRSFASYANLGGLLLAARDKPASRADIAQAIGYFDKAISIRPNFPSTYDLKAFALIMLSQAEAETGNVAKADEARELAIKSIERQLSSYQSVPYEVRGPMTQSHILFARYLLKAGRAKEALYHLQRAQDELNLSRSPMPEIQTAIDQMIAQARSLPTTVPSP